MSRLIGIKVPAFLDRTTARDLYDLRFLAERHRGDFSGPDAGAMKTAVADLDALRDRFRLAFEEDDILHGASLDEVVLDLAERFA